MSVPAPLPAEAGIRAARAGLARAECLFLGAVAALMALQLFVPPLVGLADNADFLRVAGRFGIKAPIGDPADRYFLYFFSRYAIEPGWTGPGGFLSSELLLVAPVMGLHRLISGSRPFDIRFLAFVHMALLLAGMGLLAVASRPVPAGARAVFLLLLGLAFTDVGYVAYLNSFYSEPASLVFLLLSTGLLALVLGGGTTLPLLLAAGLSMMMLVAAKPQNFLAAGALAPLFIRLGTLRSDRVWRGACAGLAALLLVTALVMFRFGNPAFIREHGMQLAVFYAILPGSPSPASDLADLGLPATLARYSGLHPWSPGAPSRNDPEFRRQFVERMSPVRLLRFYARHPRRLWGVGGAVAGRAFWPWPTMGTFEKAAGRPPGAVSRTVAVWSAVKQSVAPRSLGGVLAVFLLPLAAALALYRRQQRARPWIELWCALALVALGQLAVVTVAMGPIDPAKHTFLFKAAADLCLIGALTWGAVAAARAWTAAASTR